MRKPCFLLLVLATLAWSQEHGPKPPSSETEGARISKEVAELKRQVGEIWSVLLDLKRRQLDLEARSATAEFDPSEPGLFHRLSTDIGPLLVTFKKAEPYLDGYKVEFELGNLLSGSLADLAVLAKWGPRPPKDVEAGPFWQIEMDLWRATAKQKGFTPALRVPPGKWTTLQLVLPETRADELGRIQLSISVGRVVLTQP